MNHDPDANSPYPAGSEDAGSPAYHEAHSCAFIEAKLLSGIKATVGNDTAAYPSPDALSGRGPRSVASVEIAPVEVQQDQGAGNDNYDPEDDSDAESELVRPRKRTTRRPIQGQCDSTDEGTVSPVSAPDASRAGADSRHVRLSNGRFGSSKIERKSSRNQLQGKGRDRDDSRTSSHLSPNCSQTPTNQTFRRRTRAAIDEQKAKRPKPSGGLGSLDYLFEKSLEAFKTAIGSFDFEEYVGFMKDHVRGRLSEQELCRKEAVLFHVYDGPAKRAIRRNVYRMAVQLAGQEDGGLDRGVSELRGER